MVKINSRYRHYKGKEYIVLAVGNHSETLEEMVVYQGQYTDEEFGKNPIWIRPKSLFEGKIERDGKIIDRFELLE